MINFGFLEAAAHIQPDEAPKAGRPRVQTTVGPGHVRESSCNSKDGVAVARCMKVGHEAEGSLWEQPGGCRVGEPRADTEGVSRKWVILMFMLSSSGV